MRVAVNIRIAPWRGGERILGPNDEGKTMKLHVNKKADALYLRLDESAIVDSEEVSPGGGAGYNGANEVVGVEMLCLSERSSVPNLSALEFEAK